MTDLLFYTELIQWPLRPRHYPSCWCIWGNQLLVSTTTLRSIILATLRVFSTNTQYFTTMFLKSGVEVNIFLKGSKLSRDKNSETQNFKHFRPETFMGKLLKVLPFFSTNKLVTENILQNFEQIFHRGLRTKMLEIWGF